MDVDDQDNELVPIPTETDTKNEEEESTLIPLPIDHSMDESATIDNTNENNNNINDNDTEMKDNTNTNDNNIDNNNEQSEEQPPQPQDNTITNDNNDNNHNENNNINNTNSTEQTEQTEEIIEEEVEEGGDIMEEEEEESGDIIAPPPQPQDNDNNNNNNTNNNNTNNTNNNNNITVKKENDDKDRPKSHPITTNEQEGPRYLNIHLMREWNNGEILQWLTHRFGLWGQQYVPVFSNKKTTGSDLIELTQEILRDEYKVTKPLHLVRICRDITDAKRSLHQINQLISPQYIDGGNAASKLMRFGPKEVYAFSTRIPLLKLHAQTFLDRKINGRVLLECTDVQLVTAMKNESITLIDAQSILDFIQKIKKETTITDINSNDYLPIQAIYDVWNEMCKIHERRFKLLPQHIRDYTKPAPTYYPPPQQTGYGYGQGTTYGQHGGSGGGRQGPQGDGNVSDRSGSPPLYELKDVREWNTVDCINWLGQIKESKVDLRVRYTPHFEQIQMNGKILLNMTPSTLSSICCITTKTHLKQLVKAIDKIRDHLVFTSFGQEAHVKEFTQKYGGGYNMPTPRYHGNYDDQIERRQRYERQAKAQQQQATQQQPNAQSTQDVQVKDGGADGGAHDGGVAKCYVCGKTGNVMRCSQCKAAFYCSREHQVKDWPRHSKECQK